MFKIHRNLISRVRFLADFQGYIRRKVERLNNKVIIVMILESIDESWKRHKLWKEEFQVFE